MMGLKTRLIHLLGGVPYDFHRKEVEAAWMPLPTPPKGE